MFHVYLNANKSYVIWYEQEKFITPYVGVTIQTMLRELLLLNLE